MSELTPAQVAAVAAARERVAAQVLAILPPAEDAEVIIYTLALHAPGGLRGADLAAAPVWGIGKRVLRLEATENGQRRLLSLQQWLVQDLPLDAALRAWEAISSPMKPPATP